MDCQQSQNEKTNLLQHDLDSKTTILHWQRGDEFKLGYYHCYTLVSIDSDGWAVVEWLGNLEYARLSNLVGHNASARTRQIDKRLKESDEYMELLRQFNLSYKQLEERDKQLGIGA